MPVVTSVIFMLTGVVPEWVLSSPPPPHWILINRNIKSGMNDSFFNVIASSVALLLIMQKIHVSNLH